LERLENILVLSYINTLRGHPLVGEVRGVGLIAALELANDKVTKSVTVPVGRRGAMLNTAMLCHGAISRNLGDAVAFCPPIITTEEQAGDLFAIVKASLEEVTKEVQVG
jgi:4-aminobutyrate--pyruvate transaminase